MTCRTFEFGSFEYIDIRPSHKMGNLVVLAKIYLTNAPLGRLLRTTQMSHIMVSIYIWKSIVVIVVLMVGNK